MDGPLVSRRKNLQQAGKQSTSNQQSSNSQFSIPLKPRRHPASPPTTSETSETPSAVMQAFSMLAATLLALLCSFTGVTAAPASFPPQNSIYSLLSWVQTHQTKPTQPSSTLPAPNSSWSLKYVVLGMGTQNYTCPTTSSVPVAAGAMANLYDATTIVSAQGILGTDSTPDLACFADETNNNFALRQVGVHYFNGAGTPTFDLTKAGKGEWLSAAKMAAMPAPSNACSGRSGDAAVPWLYLTQDTTGQSRGLSAVYRLETAGGSATTCSDAVNGWVTRDYAAEYWFYG